MRTIAIEVTATRATIEQRPNWFEWLFGDRRTVLELERVLHGDRLEWRTVTTGRWIRDFTHDDAQAILGALDFRQVVELPVATARRAPGGGL